MVEDMGGANRTAVGFLWFLGLCYLTGVFMLKQGPVEGSAAPPAVTFVAIAFGLGSLGAWIYSKAAGRPMNQWAGLLFASVLVALLGLGTLH